MPEARPQAGAPSALASLAQWLSYLEGVHPVGIDMGLARVHAVAARLGLLRPDAFVFTVAGTNGKGTTVLALEALTKSAGLSVGATLSPHLFEFNERIRINGRFADDAAIVAAFVAIEAARRIEPEISLTYFEFSMLAAFWCFREARVDVMVVEVGLGGRLDASNVLDADVAVVTSIDLDHQEYLGDDRESIGLEKAGIFRAGQRVVLGQSMPNAVVERARALGCCLSRADVDFSFRLTHDGVLQWTDAKRSFALSPAPKLIAANVATALAAFVASGFAVLSASQVAHALSAVENTGRLQQLTAATGQRVVVDVGHNPHGARLLAAELGRERVVRTHLILAVLKEKDADGIVEALSGVVDHWVCAPTLGTRARAAATLVEILNRRNLHVETAPSVAAAVNSVLAKTSPMDRVVITGSFQAAAEALRCLGVTRAFELGAQ